MSSLSSKDRVSLCSFTFADGRRCRTPRAAKHLHFCFYHAQKEARARATQKLGKDLAYFFSGDYLSACDLSTALGRLIPAVVRGDVKPRAARTVAYLAQTLLQAIHISQHEYCEAFDTDDWRRAIRNSVKGNHDYLFPPAPKREKSESPRPQPQHQPAQPPAQAQQHAKPQTQAPQLAQSPQRAPAPRTPLPATNTEFVQQVVAGISRTASPGSTGKSGDSQAPFSPSATTGITGTTSPPPVQATQPASTPPPTPPAPSAAPADQHNNPPPTRPCSLSRTPNRDACLRFDHSYRLRIDGKPV